MFDIVKTAVMMLMAVLVFMVMIVMMMFMFVIMVMVMMMNMAMSAFFFPVHQHTDVCPSDPALNGRLFTILHTGDLKMVQFVNKAVRIRQKFCQSGSQHVACGAHAAVKIQGFHFLASIWLIILAR